MAVDQELRRHKETWIGFTRFMKWGVGIVVIILLLMAFFLL
jgi:hypothetical protein